VDERGAPISPSAITALVAAREIAKEKAAGRSPTVIHNLITSRTVPEVIREHGAKAVRTRVGHAFIKVEMAKADAVFGGEHSAHYYFRDFWFADTGMLAAMHVLAALGGQDRPLSEFAAKYERYVDSGEINSTVDDAKAKVEQIRSWAATHNAEVDELDGLTVALPDGRWFNVRSSNTEPLLRLNVEAADEAGMTALRDEILGIIRS
jgi:phosphomannomutase